MIAAILVPLAGSLIPHSVHAQAGANAQPNNGTNGQGLAVGAAAAGQAANPIIPAQQGAIPTEAPPPGTVPTTIAPLNAPAPIRNTAMPTQKQDAIAVLMQQATYWHTQSQPDRALESLSRALTLDPNNAEALGMMAQIRADQGDATQANANLARLRQISPNDPRIGQVERELRIGPISPSALGDARRLSQEGRNAEAVTRYAQIFKNNPPPDALSTEYYQTLAGTEGGWERARDGLAQIVRENPRDLRAQLGYAQILTYREGARAEGIARLAQLALSPAIAEQATRAWRQALTWLPIQTSSVAPLSEFLQRHPNDNAMLRELELARNPPQTGPADTAGEARSGGFRDLNARNLSGAERAFNEALALNPADADALGGLGLVRLRQGRVAEGRNLLTRAIAADPSKRGQWIGALNGTAVPVEYGNIRAMTERGDYAGAQRQIHALMGRGNNPGLMAMLADVQARSGDFAAAESSYRAALNASPNDAGVMVGLAGVLQQQGRTAEAQDLLGQAGRRGQGALRLIGQARATELRDQAKNVSDPATQEGLYRAAIAADPSNPWIRLDLARLMARRGRMPEARALMADVTNGARPTSDDLQAGIIFANENNLSSDAVALINRVPPRARTAEMRESLQTAQVNRDIQATLMFPPPVARQRLLALAAAAPDPDGTRGAAIARALYRIGMPNDARTAIATAQAVTRAPTAEQHVNYAGALMDIGDTADAQTMLRTLPPAGLSAQQRTAANQLGAGIAVKNSDVLNQAGRQAEAYDRLAPALATNPTNPDLNLALGRLYEGADKPQQAYEINMAVLRRDPSNIVARKAAVDAAIAVGNRGEADRLVREGLTMFPNDPRSWMTSADLARARGNNMRALQDLQRARELRMQQISGSDSGADSGDPSSNPGVGAAAGALQTGSTMTLAPNAPPIYSNSPPSSPAARPYSLAPNVPRYPPQAYPVQAQYYPPPVPPIDPSQGLPPQAYPPPGYANPGLATPAYTPAPTYAAPPTYAVPPTYTLPRAPAFGGPALYSNPFRSGPTVSPFGSTTLPASQEDPMTVEIDRSIAALRDQVAPTVQGGTLFRARSGTAGLDQLIEAAVPLEATFSPGGYGQLHLMAQPTFLSAGTLSRDAISQSRLGTQALSVTPPAALGLAAGFAGAEYGAQHAEGLGLDLGYKFGFLSADIGSTPIGFEFNNLIGGVELAPQLNNNVTLRLTGERRAVTDSLLSYGGQKDPRTGIASGGVTRTRGYAQLELKAGLANFYLGGGYAALDGENVVHNHEVEAGAGGSYPVWRNATDEVRVGLDLVYFGFDKNLGGFTFGDGGYFSPQSYFAALIPVSYTSKAIPKLTYTVGGALGYQVFNENSSPYYPGDPVLQAALVSQAAAVPGLQTGYNSKNSNGVTGVINARAEYSVTPSLKVGGRASYQHAGDYDEGEGLIYARYIFNGAE